MTLKFSSPPLTETLSVRLVLTSGVGSSSEKLSPWTGAAVVGDERAALEPDPLRIYVSPDGGVNLGQEEHIAVVAAVGQERIAVGGVDDGRRNAEHLIVRAGEQRIARVHGDDAIGTLSLSSKTPLAEV